MLRNYLAFARSARTIIARSNGLQSPSAFPGTDPEDCAEVFTPINLRIGYHPATLSVQTVEELVHCPYHLSFIAKEHVVISVRDQHNARAGHTATKGFGPLATTGFVFA